MRISDWSSDVVSSDLKTPMSVENAEIIEQLGRRYSAGFVTDIESDSFAPGLSEDVVRALSAKKEEPEWMAEWRVAAYRHWLTMPVPHRSGERRVGKEWVSTCRSRGSPYH